MLVYGVRTSGALVQDSVSQAPKVSKWIAPPKEKIAGAKFSQMEIGGRVTIIEKIFPIFELGLASSHREGNSKDNTFSTPTSPYFRVGFDVNLNKKRKSNRFMLGFRYGYTSFKYDFTGPDQTDPVWGTAVPLNMTGIPASAMWGEGVLEPWYIPGYGPNGGNCWGGTVNLIFDFGRSMKKGK